jgi:uncharacterized protein (DUF2267 family)
MLRLSLRHHAFPAEPRSSLHLREWLKAAPLSLAVLAVLNGMITTNSGELLGNELPTD